MDKTLHTNTFFNTLFDKLINSNEESEQFLSEPLYYFSKIVDCVSDAVIFTDKDFLIKSWNNAAEKIYGWEMEEVIGKSIWEITKADPKEVLLIKSQLRKKEAWNDEETHYHRNGNEIQVEHSIHIINGIKNELEGCVSIIKDVTAEKSAQKSKAKSLEQFKALVQNSSDLISVIDPTGKTIYLGPSIQNSLGRSTEEFYGKSVFENIHPDDLESFKAVFSEILQKPDVPISFSVRSRREDGGYLDLESVGTNRLHDPNIEGIIFNAKDITKQKATEILTRKSEELFKSMMNESSDIFSILNKNGERDYVSPSIERILGYKKEELINKSSFDYVHPDDIGGLKLFFEEVLRSPYKQLKIEYRIKCKDGHYVYLETIACNKLDDANIGGIILNGRDITERKIAEEKATKSEERFKALVQNSTDLICIIDTGGNCLYRSPSIDSVLGKKHEHPSIYDYVHPDDFQLVKHSLEELIKKPYGFDKIEFKAEKMDGEYIYLEAIINNQLGNESIEGIIINARDITERKKSEIQKKENEERIKSLLLYSSDLVAIVNEDGNRTFISSSIEVVLGRSKDALINNSILDYVHPDDKPLAQAALMQSKLEPGKPFRIEIRYFHGKGYYVDLECIISNHHQNPSIGGTIINARDITERRKADYQLRLSEQKLQSVMKHSSDFTVIVREDGTRSYVSPSVEQILGIKAEFLTDKSIFDGVHPDDLEKVMAVFERTITFPNEPIRIEYRVRHPLLKYWIYVECLGSNLLEEPSIQGVIFTIRDVTEQRKMENELKEVLEELKKRNYELDNYVYKVSHDLRAPLCSVLGLTELITIEKDNMDVIQEYNLLIYKSVQKLDNYIKAVLSHSQVINIEEQIGEVSFNSIIESSMAELKYLSNYHQIQLTTSVSEGIKLFSDEFRLTTLFKNFISNAIKYINPLAEKSWLKIEIEVNEKVARIIISDNGLGIEQIYLDKIFDMFFRANEKSDGSGLGLYIVRETTERLKGTISVKSEIGVGTTFELIIPNRIQSHITDL